MHSELENGIEVISIYPLEATLDEDGNIIDEDVEIENVKRVEAALFIAGRFFGKELIALTYFKIKYKIAGDGGDFPSENGWEVYMSGIAPAPVGEYVYSNVQLSPLEENKEVIIAVIAVAVLFLVWWLWKKRSKNVFIVFLVVG